MFVDVDDTLIRSFGPKRMPMTASVDAVKALAAAGVQLYCWSSGGADYARSSAVELGLEGCFLGFLPKPDALLDDMPIARWPLSEIHPNACHGGSPAVLAAVLSPAERG